MNTEINILELFSGIGGFSLGLTNAGFTIKKHYFSEIDKHAIANYKHNFPHAESIGSVSDVRGPKLDHPDIITFGSPCQDFSLAGKRAGMEGQRSSLITEAIRLIDECRPDVFIWENVKGAYSSNDGADFWGIIQAFTNLGGYRLEWQLLNTSWFLPQNRERIYLIGHLAERSKPGVFPFREGDFRANEINGEESASGKRIQCNAIDSNYHKGADGKRTMIREEVFCVAQRGRNPENPSDRTTGSRTEQRLEFNSKGTTNTLTSVAKDNLIQITKPSHGRSSGEEFDNISPTLLSHMGTGGDNIPYVNKIRRLTEIEVERLQGFQDNWTEYGNYEGVTKKIPKSQRYKLCGNAVTTNVVKAIGERLLSQTNK